MLDGYRLLCRAVEEPFPSMISLGECKGRGNFYFGEEITENVFSS